jgi:hypothetical protein
LTYFIAVLVVVKRTAPKNRNTVFGGWQMAQEYHNFMTVLGTQEQRQKFLVDALRPRAGGLHGRGRAHLAVA